LAKFDFFFVTVNPCWEMVPAPLRCDANSTAPAHSTSTVAPQFQTRSMRNPARDTGSTLPGRYVRFIWRLRSPRL